MGGEGRWSNLCFTCFRSKGGQEAVRAQPSAFEKCRLTPGGRAGQAGEHGQGERLAVTSSQTCLPRRTLSWQTAGHTSQHSPGIALPSPHTRARAITSGDQAPDLRLLPLGRPAQQSGPRPRALKNPGVVFHPRFPQAAFVFPQAASRCPQLRALLGEQETPWGHF